MNKESVYIIGGGESLKTFDWAKLQNKDVIAVNKAVLNWPLSKYFITMDYTFLKKIKNRLSDISKCTKIFIANFTFDFMKEENGQIKDSRYNLVYDLKEFDVIIKSRERGYFGTEFNTFSNGQNSAYCALQLAIILGYKNIYLVGLDFQFKETTHYHDGYNHNEKVFRTKLDEYYNYFKTGIKFLKTNYPDINIYNCSSSSRLSKDLEYREVL